MIEQGFLAAGKRPVSSFLLIAQPKKLIPEVISRAYCERHLYPASPTNTGRRNSGTAASVSATFYDPGFVSGLGDAVERADDPALPNIAY